MEEQGIYNNLEPKIHKRIAEAVADAAPVLDIACGDGRLSAFIASEVGSKTYGVDISISNLAKAREEAHAQDISRMVLFAAGDAQKLCFLNESFGAAIMLYSLHEIQHLSHALEEALRVLKVGGKFIVVDPVQGGKAEALWKESYYDPAGIESMVIRAGFSQLDSEFLYDDILFVSAEKACRKLLIH